MRTILSYKEPWSGTNKPMKIFCLDHDKDWDEEVLSVMFVVREAPNRVAGVLAEPAGVRTPCAWSVGCGSRRLVLSPV